MTNTLVEYYGPGCNEQRLSSGAIGIIVAPIALILIAVVIIVLLVKRRRGKYQPL